MISEAAAIPTDDRNRQAARYPQKGGRITIGRVPLVISARFNKREKSCHAFAVMGNDGRHGQKSKAEQKKVNP
jgi:hypothetical protein